MKIYVQDYGWAGCVVVVAESLEAAREMFKKDTSWKGRHQPAVIEYEIKPGHIYTCLGDQ